MYLFMNIKFVEKEATQKMHNINIFIKFSFKFFFPSWKIQKGLRG